MGGALKNLTISVLYPVELFVQFDWDKVKVERWITNAGGRALSRFTDETTHLVIGAKTWEAQGPIVQQALEARGCGRKLSILRPEWLEQSLEQRRKVRESLFTWDRFDTAIRKPTGEDEGEGPMRGKTTSGLMVEVFQQSTDRFVDENEKKDIQRRKELEEKRVREEAEAERSAREEESRRRKEDAKLVWKRGGKKSRNELFAEEHHIYADDTEVPWEMLVSKVDPRQKDPGGLPVKGGKMQLYETNAEPHQYSVNLQFVGTDKLPGSNMLVAHGCNLPTALRIFKKAFEEMTKISWTDGQPRSRARIP